MILYWKRAATSSLPSKGEGCRSMSRDPPFEEFFPRELIQTAL